MIWKEMIFMHRKLLYKTVQTGVRNISYSKALRRTHYDVLGVKRDASQADIKNAYFELSKIYHPDRIAATDENLTKFREISAAYEILGNEQSRKLYDRGLLGATQIKGIDDTGDPEDPIIKFYKQRQHRDKVPTYGKLEGDLEVWTQTFYKQVRKQGFAKNELYQGSKRILPKERNVDTYYFLITVLIVVNVVFWANFKNHPLEKLSRKLGFH